MYSKYYKRLLDIIFATLALVVLAPIIIMAALAVKIESPGPAFFLQQRVGIHKSRFGIIKFRTMREGTPADVPTERFQHADQITRVGNFLRKTSLNELPQLINIIKGEMSIIGPRPALGNQFDLIRERDKYGANDILPGLSGWAQINGRDTIDNKTKARFDGEYVKNIGFWFDAKIIVGTILTVLTNTGVVVEGGTGALARQEATATRDRAQGNLYGHGVKG